ncbi:MAG TPA: nucleotide exchange factor GrpE [Streptosporangiaceae bacterium]|nr:nucleotide exchange factor GrpE [Streptosporangiaceae bacterium]
MTNGEPDPPGEETRTEEQRAEEQRAEEQRAEQAAQGAEGMADPLGGLAERLAQVEGQLAAFHRRAAHRELVIDQLHEENQRLQAGLSRMILDPVVTDLIRLHDQLDREARRSGGDQPDGRLLRSFADDVLEILGRCGLDVFSAEPGEPFERGQHRVVGIVACDDASGHNTVAEVTGVGFRERDTGRVRRTVQAYFRQYPPLAQPDRRNAVQSE